MQVSCAACGRANPDTVRICQWCGKAADGARQPAAAAGPPVEQRAGLRLSLGENKLAVDPGQAVTTTVTVYNTGTRVEHCRIRVAGPAAEWGRADPPELDVYPRTPVTCEIRLEPPRSSACPAGVWGFAVLAESLVHTGLRKHVTGTVDVAVYHALTVRLSPQTARGHGDTWHTCVLGNQGNAKERLRLSASDPENALTIDIDRRVVLNPGEESFVRFRVTAPDEPLDVAFAIVVTPEEGQPVSAPGRRVVPRPEPKPPPPPVQMVMPAPAPAPQSVRPAPVRSSGAGLGRLFSFTVKLLILGALVLGGIKAAPLVIDYLKRLQPPSPTVVPSVSTKEPTEEPTEEVTKDGTEDPSPSSESTDDPGTTVEP